MPKVSVITPAYNYAHFLNDAIQSVLDQTFEDFESIIVDDGSTDNTKEVVSSFTDTRIRYIHQDNRGQSAAMNRGILASHGEYIAFLDSDDIWLPQKLELQVKMLDSNIDMGIVCTDAYIFDNKTGNILHQYWHNNDYLDIRNAPQDALTRLLYSGCFIKGSTPLVRRGALDHVGLFDESLVCHEDWELWVRILMHYNVVCIDIPLVKCRRHDSSVTADSERVYQGATLAPSKVMHACPLLAHHKKILRRRLASAHQGYGSYLIINNRVAEGREQFIAANRVNRWFIKPYIYLAVLPFGRWAALTIRSGKKLLQR